MKKAVNHQKSDYADRRRTVSIHSGDGERATYFRAAGILVLALYISTVDGLDAITIRDALPTRRQKLDGDDDGGESIQRSSHARGSVEMQGLCLVARETYQEGDGPILSLS